MGTVVGEPPIVQDAITDSTPDPASVAIADTVAARAVPAGQERNVSSSSQMSEGVAPAWAMEGASVSGGGVGSGVVGAVGSGAGGGVGSGVVGVVGSGGGAVGSGVVGEVGSGAGGGVGWEGEVAVGSGNGVVGPGIGGLDSSGGVGAAVPGVAGAVSWAAAGACGAGEATAVGTVVASGSGPRVSSGGFADCGADSEPLDDVAVVAVGPADVAAAPGSTASGDPFVTAMPTPVASPRIATRITARTSGSFGRDRGGAGGGVADMDPQVVAISPAGGGTAARAANNCIGATNALRLASQMSHSLT
jgi:hypothetical protein